MAMNTRIEHDTMGEIAVPADCFWGAQTQRSVQNFPIGTERQPKEILTVDNHADGPYVWMRMKREDPKRAEEIFELLQYNEGNNSGRGIGCISWDGKVHADQFWRNHTFGNVLERPFSEIWDDPNIELLHKLKDKKAHVGGRCAKCRFLNICGGNFRARAEAYYGDEWAQDPACYLTDEEIGL